jgi:hypothetical protein
MASNKRVFDSYMCRSERIDSIDDTKNKNERKNSLDNIKASDWHSSHSLWSVREYCSQYSSLTFDEIIIALLSDINLRSKQFILNRINFQYS